jgi:hypothetical protein
MLVANLGRNSTCLIGNLLRFPCVTDTFLLNQRLGMLKAEFYFSHDS